MNKLKIFGIISICCLAFYSIKYFYPKDESTIRNNVDQLTVAVFDVKNVIEFVYTLKNIRQEMNEERKSLNDSMNTFQVLSSFKAEDIVCYRDEINEVTKDYIQLLNGTKKHLTIAQNFAQAVKNNKDLDSSEYYYLKMQKFSKEHQFFLKYISSIKNKPIDFKAPYRDIKNRVNKLEPCIDRGLGTI